MKSTVIVILSEQILLEMLFSRLHQNTDKIFSCHLSSLFIFLMQLWKDAKNFECNINLPFMLKENNIYSYSFIFM